MSDEAERETWDMGDPEPENLTALADYTADTYDPYDQGLPEWHRTYQGKWKGYKNGHGVYLDWPELARRWGPLTKVVDR